MLLWNELCATKKIHTFNGKATTCFTLNQIATLGVRKTESQINKTKARCLHTDNKQFMFAAAAIIK